jgi:hypothetical protein
VTIGPYSLSVLTAARTIALVPLADVKLELGISDSSEDARLIRLIAAASRAFASDAGLGREPWRQQYLERLAGFGRQILYLSRFPVESISSLTLSGQEVEAETYYVSGRWRDYLHRELGWPRTGFVHAALTEDFVPGFEELDYAATYWAGWLLPDQVTDWEATEAYVVGDFVRSSDPTVTLRFEATTAGTSDATEPTWPTEAGDTVADDSVVWTARAAFELPEDLRQAALDAVVALYSQGLARQGIKSHSFEGARIEYVDTAAGGITSAVRDVLRAYR